MAFVAKVRSYIAGWLTLGVLGAVVLVGVSIWQVIDNFEVATEPAVVQHNALPALAEGEKRYVRIEGGYYDEDNALAEHYGHSNFLLLQSDYQSKTLLEQLGEVLMFIGLLIVVILLRWLVAPKAEV